MIRRSFRIGLRVGLLGGIAAAAVKTVQSWRGARRPSPNSAVTDAAAAAWPPLDEPRPVAPVPPAPEQADTHLSPEVPDIQADDSTPAPVRKSSAKKAPAARKATRPGKKAAGGGGAAWVEPTGSVCPPSHPIKAKLSSRLYHLPGMFAYARTTPDRCYRSEDDAATDGLSKAKR